MTRTGLTAELLSRGRTQGAHLRVQSRRRGLSPAGAVVGHHPVHQDLAADLEANIEAMEHYLVEHQSAQLADTVVITGSHPFEVGRPHQFRQVPRPRRNGLTADRRQTGSATEYLADETTCSRQSRTAYRLSGS